MNNIIQFENFINKKKTLSDDEIKSLFLGLVNLIKTNAIDDVSNKIKEDYKKNSITLNNTLLELKLKNELLNELKAENESLKSKMNKLLEKIEKLKKSNIDINKF